VNTPFSGWREGLRFYGPVVGLGVLLTAGLAPTGYAWAGAIVLLAGIAMMLFFRDFPRRVTAAAEELVSPADGTIVAIEDLEETPHYDGSTRRVSIFLSILSAHVNRAPYPGTVTDVKYAPGKFKNAMNPESSKVNESNAVYFDTDRGPLTVRQISGAVARRIVCPAGPGSRLEKGEKFGMIRFGSRVELYLPPGTDVCVQLNDHVYAGLTIMAQFS